MARVVRTFTLESELSNTLDTLVKSGTASPLLLCLFEPSHQPAESLPSLNFDESGLCVNDYARFYAMLPATKHACEPSMRALLTVINMYGQEQMTQILTAVNKTILENTKTRKAEEWASWKSAASDIRNYRNVSRIAEALINTGLETLERKVAALDTSRSAKSDASQGGHK